MAEPIGRAVAQGVANRLGAGELAGVDLDAEPERAKLVEASLQRLHGMRFVARERDARHEPGSAQRGDARSLTRESLRRAAADADHELDLEVGSSGVRRACAQLREVIDECGFVVARGQEAADKQLGVAHALCAQLRHVSVEDAWQPAIAVRDLGDARAVDLPVGERADGHELDVEPELCGQRCIEHAVEMAVQLGQAIHVFMISRM